MFITDQDRIMLMDIANVAGRTFNDDEMAALRDTGCSLMLMFSNDIDATETAPGVYDWRNIDGYVERSLRHGYKVLIASCTNGPTWGPDNWYVQFHTGIQRGVMSPWSVSGQEYLMGYYRKLIERYASEQVVVVNTQQSNGETLMCNEPAWYSADALASYERVFGAGATPVPYNPFTDGWLRDTYLNMMRNHALVLADQPVKLLYTAIHPMIAQFGGLYGNGNQWYPDLFNLYRANFPGHEIMWVLYTFVQWQQMFPAVRAIKEQFGVKVFGGAEYAEGLPWSTPMSIQAGIDGQLTGPCHPFTGHAQVEPFMLDNFRAAYAQWMAK